MVYIHVKNVMDFIFTVMYGSLSSVSRIVLFAYVTCLTVCSALIYSTTVLLTTRWAKNKQLNTRCPCLSSYSECLELQTFKNWSGFGLPCIL